MMKTRYILATAVMILVVMMFAVNGCGGGGSSSGGGDEPDTIVETPALYNEKEITAEGGSISITDEYNNKIEVTFPKDVLSETTKISLGVLSEQPDLPIETQHISAFEIKPYNADLYGSVFIMVTYENAIQDMNRTLLFRKKTDSLLIPLADHEYFTYGGIADNKTFRAYAFILGVFAEGKMSSDQVKNQFDLLLASKEIDLGQKKILANEEPIDSTCYTEINKNIWLDWKETAFAMDTYYKSYYAEQILGVNQDLAAEDWDSILARIVNHGGQIVYQCIPEDICDRNYVYTIMDALGTIQNLGIMDDNEVYAKLYNHHMDIVTKCIKDGTLVLDLSYSSVVDVYGPKDLEFQGEAHGAVPLVIETINDRGFAEINDDYNRIPPFVFSGSGITYIPGDASECQVDWFGHIEVEVAGSKDRSDVYTLQVVTHHHTGQTVECPSLPVVTYPPSHRASNMFKIILSPENDYKYEGTAEGDSRWNISAELVLPQP